MTIQFCKSCQQNNVNTRVEWRDNPDKPGKKKQFDIDKEEWHKCPFWKPDPNYKKTVPPEIKQEFENIEKQLASTPDQQVSLRDIKNDLNVFSIETYKRLSTLERLLGDFGTALAKISIQRASDLK